jgi:hypothetical protein
MLFFLIGPLIVPIIWAIDGLNYAVNMGFFGCSFGVFFQYFFWIALVLMDVLIIFFNNENLGAGRIIAVYA